MRSNSINFDILRKYIEQLPVIESHEHYTCIVEEPLDAINHSISTYNNDDFMSSSFGMEKEVNNIMGNTSEDFDKRYDVFEKIYNRSNLTADARGVAIGLKKCWGVEEISRISIRSLQEKLKKRTPDLHDKWLSKCNIKARITDIVNVVPYVEGKNKNYSSLDHFVLDLPKYHNLHSKEDIDALELEDYLERPIITLDDYMEAFENLVQKCMKFGIVGFKDNSAYWRAIDYGNPAKADAEKEFNAIMGNFRNKYAEDQVRELDDWLFNQFMRIAGKYKLPVQIHTGHLVNMRNDIRNANAVQLIPLIERFSNVRFVLFHGNWPYMGEFLFLGKNYPNVFLDLCWAQLIDPFYCIELMKRAIVTLSHKKIFGFGGDTRNPEWTVGYLEIAKDNIAIALAELVDMEWIDISKAKEVAADWLFNNVNEFYGLGLEPYTNFK